MFGGIVLLSVTAFATLSLRGADMPTRLRWAAVYLDCLIAPALTSWFTWIRLKRYMPFVPREVKRLLLSAAGAFILFGLYGFMLALSAGRP